MPKAASRVVLTNVFRNQSKADVVLGIMRKQLRTKMQNFGLPST